MSGSPAPAGLRRALGLVEVTAGGVGIIIGAGIYVLLGAATAQAGSTVWIAFVGLVAVTGITQSARLTLALSAVQVGGLLLIVAIGAPHVGDVDLFAGPGPGGVVAAAALVWPCSSTTRPSRCQRLSTRIVVSTVVPVMSAGFWRVS